MNSKSKSKSKKIAPVKGPKQTPARGPRKRALRKELVRKIEGLVGRHPLLTKKVLMEVTLSLSETQLARLLDDTTPREVIVAMMLEEVQARMASYRAHHGLPGPVVDHS